MARPPSWCFFFNSLICLVHCRNKKKSNVRKTKQKKKRGMRIAIVNHSVFGRSSSFPGFQMTFARRCIAASRYQRCRMQPSGPNSHLFTYTIGVIRHPVQECTTLLTILSDNGPCGHTRSGNQAHGDSLFVVYIVLCQQQKLGRVASISAEIFHSRQISSLG